MNKMSCEIIKDLLPLYYDDVCSNDSKLLVEKHINECTSCRKYLDNIGGSILLESENLITDNIKKNEMIKKFSDVWNKQKRKSFTKGLLSSFILVSVLFLIYCGLFKWAIIPVPTEVIKISNISIDSDGVVSYDYEFTDGKKVYRSSSINTDDGVYYETFYRQLIPAKDTVVTHTNSGHSIEQYYYYDKDLKEKVLWKAKAMYVGTPSDRIFIWEEGTELPIKNN